MGAPPTTDGTLHPAGTSGGVWLTDREPGELLGARRVVVYIGDSAPIVVAEVESRAEAEEIAERLMEMIDRVATTEEWVELGDRLVRPGAIASIDVELAE
jgi:hypothetical protein